LQPLGLALIGRAESSYVHGDRDVPMAPDFEAPMRRTARGIPDVAVILLLAILLLVYLGSYAATFARSPGGATRHRNMLRRSSVLCTLYWPLHRLQDTLSPPDPSPASFLSSGEIPIPVPQCCAPAGNGKIVTSGQ
jgi:hypothetical protein